MVPGLKAVGHGYSCYEPNQGGDLGSDGRWCYIYIRDSGPAMSSDCE